MYIQGVQEKKFPVFSCDTLYMFSFDENYSSLTPEQKEYKCFENDLEPIDTNESFDEKCLDNAGNVHFENATLTSCCECFRF